MFVIVCLMLLVLSVMSLMELVLRLILSRCMMWGGFVWMDVDDNGIVMCVLFFVVMLMCWNGVWLVGLIGLYFVCKSGCLWVNLVCFLYFFFCYYVVDLIYIIKWFIFDMGVGVILKCYKIGEFYFCGSFLMIVFLFYVEMVYWISKEWNRI